MPGATTEITVTNLKSSNCENGQDDGYSNTVVDRLSKSENMEASKGISSNEIPVLWPQLLVAATGAIIHISAELNWVFSGVFLPELTNPNSTDITMTIGQASIFVSVVNIGQILGALFNGFINAWVGQRVTLMIFLPIGLVGWIIQSLTSSYGLLILSRIILGFYGGLSLTCTNNYIIEIAHAPVRGRLLAITDVARPLGLVYLSVLSLLNFSWRTSALIAATTTYIPPVIVLFFLPNSPRWLATVNRKEEAKASLKFLRGKSYDIDTELTDIVAQLKSFPNSAKVGPQIKSLKSKSVIKVFASFSVIMFILHFAGYAVTLGYIQTIFETANTGMDKNVSLLVTSAVRILGSLAYLLIADRVRRKLLLTLPLFASAVCMTTLGLYFFLMENSMITDISWLPLTSLIVYYFVSNMYYSVIMLLRSEVLPTIARAFGSGLHYVLMSVGAFIITLAYPYMIESMGPDWTYWFFALNAVVIILISVYFIPETLGKTLEEIADRK